MNYTQVRERRRQAAIDGQAEAIKHNLNEQETYDFLFHVDSNAIWDAQANLPYKKIAYIKKAEEKPVPMYTELGYLSNEEYKKITGKEKPK